MSPSLFRRALSAATAQPWLPALVVSMTAVLFVAQHAPKPLDTGAAAQACSQGFELERESNGLEMLYGDRDATRCVPVNRKESMSELMAREAQFSGQRGMPAPGELMAAFKQRKVLSSPQAKAAVPGSGGDWRPYGKGPLISNDSRFPRVNGLGLVELAGRVDSLDYDPVHKRLFASVGTGGVWMSTDLAESWVSIGETLPSQTVGSVVWTEAGGGTVLALGGEPSFGGNNYNGLGAFWSDDLGVSWHIASGVPDNIMGFRLAVDQSQPEVVFAATSRGLYRSADAGRSYERIILPVGGGCDEKLDQECQFAHFVTDVRVRVPGGTTNAEGGAVVALVGYRAGQRLYPDGKMHSPGNGIYKSATGEPGTFAAVTGAYAATAASPSGFMPRNRVGRSHLAQATGSEQNHNYLYAIVGDAVLFNGGVELLDVPDPLVGQIGTATALTPSSFGGLYVSANFGDTWTKMADTPEISNNPSAGSSLTGTSAPGQQSWYNLWMAIDPTQALGGIPTRLAFGLEEIWAPRLPGIPLNGIAQAGNNDFKVVADYFAGTSCAGFNLGSPVCPTSNAPLSHTTAHPDQHVGLFVPDETGGGVTLVAGHDGGISIQHLADGEELANDQWGDGKNRGFNTLLPYGLAVAKDGTLWFGLQDNGSGKVFSETAAADADKGKIVMAYGGDGFYAAVDPDDSNVAYTEYTNGDMRVTTNGGTTWTNIPPNLTGAQFGNFFKMDPTDAKHIVTAGREVKERLNGPSGAWVTVYDAGTNPVNNQNYQQSTLDVEGAAVYVGLCGVCDILNKANLGFYNALATNVGKPTGPTKGSSDGWHLAAKNGLPNRWIGAIEIDPANPSTVYVGLGDYANRQWASRGAYYQDTNASLGSGRLFKSIDAGENFVDITGSLPDAPITALQLYNGQLIAGGDLGVYIASDTNGSDWAVLGNGLPVTPVGQFQISPYDPNQLFVAAYGRGFYSYAFADPVPPPPPTGNKLPIASLTATPSTGSVPVTVTFDASQSSDPDAGDAVVSYTFDFGDGSDPAVDVTNPLVTHTYNTAGQYRTVLTVKDKSGAVSLPVFADLKFTPGGSGPANPDVPGDSQGRFGGGALGAAWLLMAGLLAGLRRRRS